MNKAVFLDRDGVINKEKKDYVKKIEEFEIFENIYEAIKIIKKKGFLVIIITNQSAVNRNLLSETELLKIHNHLKNKVEANGSTIDFIYYCPHRPDEDCECRKPKPGLIINASKDFRIDLQESYLIGNSNSDILAANAAGCKGILLNEGESLLDLIKIHLS